MQDNHGKGSIDNLRPKAAFKAGLLSGLGVMFAIGFFVLLGMMLNGKDLGDGKDKINNNNNAGTANVNTNNNPSADTGTGEIVIDDIKDGDWLRGDKNAPVTIIEFSDIDCPFCTRFHDTMRQVMTDYAGQVNWVYRHFPLTSLHPEAAKKAEAAECVGELGGNDAFWNFLDQLFDNSETLSGVADMAASVGVNKSDFQECLDSGKYTSLVNGEAQEAQRAGGRGTPYSVILAGDQKIAIPGALPYDSIKASLDSLVK